VNESFPTIPDLRRFRAFVVLAEELHFGRAARRLSITQSPLSRLITGLERDIGTPLFTRSHHGVRLTAAGQSLLDDARHIIEHVDMALRRAHERALGDLA
jgi:DNA-binding transcriptional LysR family regulator